jgi:hypothetical protein
MKTLTLSGQAMEKMLGDFRITKKNGVHFIFPCPVCKKKKKRNISDFKGYDHHKDDLFETLVCGCCHKDFKCKKCGKTDINIEKPSLSCPKALGKKAFGFCNFDVHYLEAGWCINCRARRVGLDILLNALEMWYDKECEKRGKVPQQIFVGEGFVTPEATRQSDYDDAWNSDEDTELT